ncbi:MAG: RNA polymerase sigma factor [Anaerolineae bacterium]|jgi:RNA polymerase sigma-70 factor (ECF subfamily)
MKERTNQEWLADLKGPGREEALADLRAFLLRGLGYALASRSDVDQTFLEDFVQDALLRILDALDTFRGESKFTTWAQKIAVNVAFTELRRRRWQSERVSLEGWAESFGLDFVPDLLIDPSAGPDQQLTQRIFLETLHRLITTELTEKQRQALIAVKIHGMPLAEVARRMGSNRNALYKLVHDARQRLKGKMEEEGLSPDEVLAAFGAQLR